MKLFNISFLFLLLIYLIGCDRNFSTLEDLEHTGDIIIGWNVNHGCYPGISELSTCSKYIGKVFCDEISSAAASRECSNAIYDAYALSLCTSNPFVFQEIDCLNDLQLPSKPFQIKSCPSNDYAKELHLFKNLQPSPYILDILRAVESISTKLYNDDGGGRHCTIGYGHIVHRGPCSLAKDHPDEREFLNGITRQEAELIFQEDVRSHVNLIRRLGFYNDTALTQAEFDSLLSLVYNTGMPNLLREIWNDNGFQESRKQRNLNKFDEEVRRSFSYSRGKFLMGLHQRRVAEAMLKNGVCPKTFNP
jgi:GH24 family phage-related lysozyme (muramidase)